MNETQTRWLKVLRCSALFVLVTGLLPTFGVFEATQEPWRLFFDILTWPLDQQPAGFTAGERQLSAVLGGVLCGWAFLLYRLADPSIFNEKIRKSMVQSVWIWFLLDSGGSVFAQLPLNAINNLTFLALLLIPLTKLKTESSP